MSAVIGALRAELSASIAQFQSDMGKAADTVKSVGGQMTRVGNDWRRVGVQMQAVGTALTKSVTLPLVGLGAAAFKAGADFEQSFASVRKTVEGVVDKMGELTPEGEKLRQGFRDLAKEIPVSVSELAKLGGTAGALNVPIDKILEFSEVMAKLGVTTNLTSDQAAESIAQIQAIYQSVGQDTDRFAAALVDLGNRGASTESQILELANRLASAGSAIKLSQDEVLAFAAAMANVGINAEAGGSSMSKIFNDISVAVSKGGAEVEKFARFTELGIDGFVKLFEEDASAAIVAFIEGMGKAVESGENLNLMLNDLGFIEHRQARALRDLALSGENLANTLKIAADGWRENTALTKEAAQFFATTYGQLTLLWNRIKDVGVTLFFAFKPAIDSAIEGLNKFIPFAERMAFAFAELPGSIQLSILAFAGLAVAMGPLVYAAGQVIFSASQIVLAFGKKGFAARALIATFGLLTTAMKAVQSAIIVDGALMFEWGKSTVSVGTAFTRFGSVLSTLVTTALGPLSVALRGLVVVFGLLTSPITLTVAAIAALGLAIIALTGHWDDLKRVVTGTIQFFKDIGTIIAYVAGSVIGDAIQAVKEFGRSLVEGLSQGVQTVIATLDDLARALLGSAYDAIAEFGKEAMRWFKDLIPQWVSDAAASIKSFAAQAKDDVLNFAGNVHKVAEGIREFKNVADSVKPPQLVPKGGVPEIMSFDQALGLLKEQLKGTAPAAAAMKDAVAEALKKLREAKDPAEEAAKAILKMEEAIQELVNGFTGGGLLDKAKQYEAALKKIGGTSTLTKAETEELADTYQDVIDKYRLLGDKGKSVVEHFSELLQKIRPIPQALKDIERSTFSATFAQRGFLEGIESVGQAISTNLDEKIVKLKYDLFEIERGTHAANFGMSGLAEGLENVGRKLEPSVRDLELFWKSIGKTDQEIKILIDDFNRAPGAILTFEQAIEGMAVGLTTLGQTIKIGLLESLRNIPQLLMSALTGGGGIMGAVRSIGASIGSGVGGAIGMALAGPLGAAVGAALGSAAGAGIGKLVDALHKSEGEKVMADVGKQWGVTITEALADSIAETAKKLFKNSHQIAEAFHIGDIIKAAGGLDTSNIEKFTAKLRDLFVFVGSGAMTASQAAEVLDDNFQDFADHFLANGPLISKELVDIIRLSEEMGVKSKAISEFVTGQILNNVVAGLKTFTDASKNAAEQLTKNKERSKELQDQLGDLRERIAEVRDQLAEKPSSQSLQAELAKLVEEESKLSAELDKTNTSIQKQQGLLDTIAISSQGAAEALAYSVSVAFSKLQDAGTPIFEIVEQLEPIVAELGKRFEEAGFTGGQAFAELQATIALARDEIAGPALQSINALGQVLAGLNNTGKLTQQSFSGLTDQITTTFNELVAGGADGSTALGLIRKPLQTVWELSQDFGYAVDEATQALLDQAVAGGLVGDKFRPIQEQMLKATERIAVAVEGLARVFGVVLPEQAGAGAAGVGRAYDVIEVDTENVKTKVAGLGHEFGTELPRKLQDGTMKMGGSFQSLVRGVGNIRTTTEELGIRWSDWLPKQANFGARQIQSAFSNLSIRIPIEFDVNDPVMPQGVKLPGFQHGSDGLRDFGPGTLAMLHGREAVVTEDEYREGYGNGKDIKITIAPVFTINGATTDEIKDFIRNEAPAATVRAARLGLLPELQNL